MEKFFLGNKMVMILMVLSTLDACDVRAGYTHYTCCLLFIVTGYNLNEYWPELFLGNMVWNGEVFHVM